jgi:MFS family permease
MTQQTARTPEAEKPAALRAHRAFMLLWAGQSVSMLGSSVSNVVVPLMAAVTLRATVFQVGLLNFVQLAPSVVLMLFIGVLVDRVRRRPLLIGADLGRVVVVGAIPLLALAGVLNIWILSVCALVAGVLAVVFNLSYFAYTPHVLPRELLLEGNSRMQLTQQVTGLMGPGIASALIAVIRIPYIVTLDAFSYLVSALSLIMIRKPEPAPARREGEERRVLHEIGEGLRVTFGNRYLRPVVLNAAAFNLCSQVILTLFVFFATRTLGLAAGWIGLVFAAGALGGTAGSVVIGRVARRSRFGPTFVGSMVLTRVALPLTALVHGPKPVLIAEFTAIWFVALFGLVASNAMVVTLRQHAVPNKLRGRTNAAYQTLSFGVAPLGALAAGLLASAVGVRPTLGIAAVLIPLSLLFIVFSPVPRMKDVKEAAPAQ